VRIEKWLLVWAGIVMASGGVHAQVTREFIWEEAPFPSAHASTIVQAPSGRLLASWFGGSGEGNLDVGIWLAHKEPGAAAWTAPREIYKEPKQPAWNPVLFVDAENVLWLYFKIGPSPMSWSGAYVTSTDEGETWTEIEWLPGDILGPIRAKPIILSNGDILAGSSVETYKTWSSHMEISADGGATWHRTNQLLFNSAREDRGGTIQPTLLEVEPGVVRAFFRTRRLGKIATSISHDHGRTWAPLTLTEIDHPGAGVDAVRLKDGRCVLIYNPSTRGRNPLSLAVSHDGGATWAEFIEVERLEEGQRGELSYPAIIQAENGDLHMTYTWLRQRIRHAVLPLSAVPSSP
jgi:predicted neuraminidase